MVATAQRIERLDRLERIIQTQSLLVQADLALNPFMQLVIDKLRELTQAHGASVEFVDGGHTVVRRASGAMAGHLGLRIANDTATVQRCDDAETDARVDRDTCRRLGVRSLIVAPLRQGGTAVGVLKVVSEQPQAFDDGDVQMLQLMASAIVAALAKKAALDARNEAEARLRTSEERMRALL
jgi:GAF domain-containing protein